MKQILLLSSDDNYTFLLGTALCSFFEHNKGDVYVFDGGISEKNKERLGVLEDKYEFKINYLIPPSIFERFPIKSWSTAMYYKFLLGRIPAPRVLYLDCDVLIRKNIQELFDVDLHGNIIGAVKDAWPLMRENFTTRFEIPTPMYFNAGVFLINLDLWRKDGIEDKLFKFARENAEKLEYPDQDVLNAVLWDKCLDIDLKYNFRPELDNGEPTIIHWASAKPWYRFSGVPYQNEYINCLDKTPWKKEKYRKLMNATFVRKYHMERPARFVWNSYKISRKALRDGGVWLLFSRAIRALFGPVKEIEKGDKRTDNR